MQKKFIILILIFSFLIIIPISQEVSAAYYHFVLEGEINTAQFSFINDALNQAEAENAEAVILEINSLGGYVDPALKIRDRIFSSEVSIITFINGRAWSAAALIALTGDEIYISPGASIGAAETRPNEEKFISALRKEFASTAEKNGRNGELAEAMVDADIAVDGVIEEGKLLTLTAQEALELGMADFSAADIGEISEIRGIDESEIIRINKSRLQQITGVLTNPYISGLLLFIAFSGLIFEALTPGFALGGTVGIAALLLFFAGHILTGSLGTGMLALFIIGLVLILLEIFVIPGFGIAGISGISALLISLFFAFPSRAVALNVLLAVVFLTIISGFLMVKKFGTSRIWNKISLETDSKDYFSSSNKKDYLNKNGLTITKLRPAGTIKINGDRVDAVSEGGFIDKDVNVKVISVSGSRVVVRPDKKEE